MFMFAILGVKKNMFSFAINFVQATAKYSTVFKFEANL